MTKLQQVAALGQQIWLDSLSRSLIQSGALAEKLADGVMGITSNPAIFQQAFQNDALYTEELAALKQQNLDAKSRYETMAIADVRNACLVCLPVYQANNGQAGMVSLEVSPSLAHDAAGTVAEGKRLWHAINQPNAMIKVPATAAGIEALRELVAAGINVNMTLIFSRAVLANILQAHAQGLQQRLDLGLPVDKIAVVASFFLSRVDTALDISLPEHLQGKVALALARAAYADWQDFVDNGAWQALAGQGAHAVQLLWASTGTKNPAYPDTLYVDQLIGANTVNTVPDKTLSAFIDHGTASATLDGHKDTSLHILSEVAALGIDIEALALRLRDDGLQQFEDAFAKILDITA